ncbi:glycyl aminopeptidase [Halobacteria archaeon HArc-gm2]|nr:glycyl aminopeptidase [Halobacteria archaeon HArc-gm2]
MTCGPTRPVAAVLLVLLVAGSAAGATVTGPLPGESGPGPATGVHFAAASAAEVPVLGDAAPATDGSTIYLDQTLHRLPDRPGEYEADNRYRLPDHAVKLEVTAPERATGFRTDGFTDEGDGVYAWDGETEDPRLRFRMPANRTVDRDDPLSGPGSYLFVDTGEWGIVQRPALGHAWGWRGSPSVTFDRSLSASPGAAGSDVAYLGEYAEYEHTAHGQRFRLVVPAEADLAENRSAVFGTLANASDGLRVGDRDDEVFLIAAPTTDVRWGARGVQTGDADAWVRDVERVDDVENVWVHEYVHTRQAYETTGQVRWFTEAAASYYAALHAFEQERVSFRTFQGRLERGTDARHESAVLADTGTWRYNPDYYVGPLVLGDLDRRTRTASDSERALHTVFARLNDADGTVDAGQFYEYVADTGGTDDADLTRRYAETTERPTVWNVSTHQAVFGPVPAQIEYEIATTDDGEDAVRANGPYRNRTLRTPYVLVPGEQLSVDVYVENSGGTAGDYDVRLRDGETTLDRRTGRIAAGNATTVTVNHSFDEPGTHELRVGGERLSVNVWEPAAAEVTGLRTDSGEAVRPGESVTVAVTVRNDAGWPGERDVRVTAADTTESAGGGEKWTVAERTVRLDAESERTVTATVTFDEPGTYRLGVADGNVTSQTVTVAAERGPDPNTGPLPVTLVVVAVLVAVLVAALLAKR